MLQLKNIYAGYGKKQILQGLSLTVEEKDIVSVIGSNGAGKSTLLKVIAGLLKPDRGEIYYKDKNIVDVECNKRVQQGIVYFLQGGEIFSGLSVKENLILGRINNYKIEGNNSFDEVMDLFPLIKKVLTKRAGLLSGGERQQVAIAMVLLKNPYLLLLDEPSAGLAPDLVKETMQKIRDIREVFGTTILLIEQNIQEALQVASKALVMKNGSIKVETNKPLELLENRKLENLFFGDY